MDCVSVSQNITLVYFINNIIQIQQNKQEVASMLHSLVSHVSYKDSRTFYIRIFKALLLFWYLLL
jgi:hypothetical protein